MEAKSDEGKEEGPVYDNELWDARGEVVPDAMVGGAIPGLKLTRGESSTGYDADGVIVKVRDGGELGMDGMENTQVRYAKYLP